MATATMRDRTWRLFGDGRSQEEDQGGGLDRATLFQVVLEAAWDEGSVTLEGVADLLRKPFSYKRSRLGELYSLSNYGSVVDPYVGLATDTLDQLVAAGLLAAEAGVYRFTDKVVLGRQLLVARAVKGRRAGVGITLHAPEDRARREAEKTVTAERNALIADLEPHGDGLRRLDRDRVQWLVGKMRLEGFRPSQPILKDQKGRILDGRHRMAAANRLGIKPAVRTIKVDSDEDAVLEAVAANTGAEWSRRERAQLEARLRTARLDDETRAAEKAARELAEQPDRTDQEVADAVGVDRSTVSRTRADMVAEGEPVARPSAQDRAREAIEQNPGASTREIAEAAGVSQSTATRAQDSESSGAAHQMTHSTNGDGKPDRRGPAGTSWRFQVRIEGKQFDDLAYVVEKLREGHEKCSTVPGFKEWLRQVQEAAQ